MMPHLFKMSEVVKQVGIAASTIRYYEAIKLTPPAQRSQKGYRFYTAADIERLRFIQRAKALDFSLNEIAEILELREQGQAPCAYVISQNIAVVVLLSTSWPKICNHTDSIVTPLSSKLCLPSYRNRVSPANPSPN